MIVLDVQVNAFQAVVVDAGEIAQADAKVLAQVVQDNFTT